MSAAVPVTFYQIVVRFATDHLERCWPVTKCGCGGSALSTGVTAALLGRRGVARRGVAWRGAADRSCGTRILFFRSERGLWYIERGTQSRLGLHTDRTEWRGAAWRGAAWRGVAWRGEEGLFTGTRHVTPICARARPPGQGGRRWQVAGAGSGQRYVQPRLPAARMGFGVWGGTVTRCTLPSQLPSSSIPTYLP